MSARGWGVQPVPSLCSLAVKSNSPGASWRPCPWRGSDPTSGRQSGPSSPWYCSDAPEGRALHPPRVEAPRLSDGLSLVIFSLHSSLS